MISDKVTSLLSSVVNVTVTELTLSPTASLLDEAEAVDDAAFAFFAGAAFFSLGMSSTASTCSSSSAGALGFFSGALRLGGIEIVDFVDRLGKTPMAPAMTRQYSGYCKIQQLYGLPANQKKLGGHETLNLTFQRHFHKHCSSFLLGKYYKKIV